MKKSSLILFLGLATAALPALAQTPDPNKWDISKLDVSKLPPAATKTGITYEADIRPIFQASCFGCHGEQRPRGEYRVDSLEAVLKGGKAGKMVVPGSGDKSLLVLAVSQLDKATMMPPPPRRGPGGPGGPGGGPGGPGGPPPGAPGAPQAAPQALADEPPAAPPAGGPGGPPGGQRRPSGPPPKPLTAEQVGLVRAWIDQGAK